MTHPSKRKGDKAELEVQGILQDLLGVPARRKLGAGRKDDMGDIDGVPDTVISVGNISRLSEAIREKPKECEVQQQRAGALFGATFVRLFGGEYRVVLTVEQWTTLWREAQPLGTAAMRREFPQDCPNCGLWLTSISTDCPRCMTKFGPTFECVVDESAGLA